MNIDYSEIITKANARKAALQALTKELESAEGYAADLFDALDYFDRLATPLEAVDLEGRAMLGPVPAQLFEISKLCKRLRFTLASDSCNSIASMPNFLHSMSSLGNVK